MNDESPKLDVLQLAGLRPRKKSEEEKKYAGFNRRMLAATIDSFIIMLTLAPAINFAFNHLYGPVAFDYIATVQKMGEQPNQAAANLYMWNEIVRTGYLARWLANFVIQTFILFVATGVFWHYWGATPGKILLKMRIVDATTGGPISNGQIILRLFGYIVSAAALGIGYFWISFDKRRQGWHDKIANTVVIAEPWFKSNSTTADPSGSPAPSSAE